MFNVTKQVVPGMVEKGWGRIIQISSVNGEKGQAGQTNYSAAKAGMHGFTMALAQELAAKGVTVNTVSPGYIGTDMVRAIKPESPGEDRCHDPGQAPGHAGGDRLHRRLAGGAGLRLHDRRRLQLQRRIAHGKPSLTSRARRLGQREARTTARVSRAPAGAARSANDGARLARAGWGSAKRERRRASRARRLGKAASPLTGRVERRAPPSPLQAGAPARMTRTPVLWAGVFTCGR
jgi:NAD(P)-dependent dehydrogenase (short-subunit alcohol dehydrogenase family)